MLSRELEELKTRAGGVRTSCLTQVLDHLADYFGSMEDPPAWFDPTEGATQEFGELVDAALGGALSSVGLPLSSPAIRAPDLEKVAMAVVKSMGRVYKRAGSQYIRDAMRRKCAGRGRLSKRWGLACPGPPCARFCRYCVFCRQWPGWHGRCRCTTSRGRCLICRP